MAITLKLYKLEQQIMHQNFALSDDMNCMQISSECRSGEVKMSRNIWIGHNLEATHLSRVCMHKIGSMIQLWP